ncbi:hypothetical protein JOF40_002236 [Aeromicrobium fastidiosum]|nr:hypothetical protein [Aeromicrobium fastidiosum]
MDIINPMTSVTRRHAVAFFAGHTSGAVHLK